MDTYLIWKNLIYICYFKTLKGDICKISLYLLLYGILNFNTWAHAQHEELCINKINNKKKRRIMTEINNNISYQHAIISSIQHAIIPTCHHISYQHAIISEVNLSLINGSHWLDDGHLFYSIKRKILISFLNKEYYSCHLSIIHNGVFCNDD